MRKYTNCLFGTPTIKTLGERMRETLDNLPANFGTVETFAEKWTRTNSAQEDGRFNRGTTVTIMIFERVIFVRINDGMLHTLYDWSMVFDMIRSDDKVIVQSYRN